MHKRGVLLFSLGVIATLMILGTALWRKSVQPGRPRLEVARRPSTATVMTIGGSVAHGWNDKQQGGYLARTFRSLSAVTNTTYTYVDKTIIGANAVQLQETLYKGKYEKWLDAYKPDIVVISWGLLNDCLPNTPMNKFNKYLTQEIQMALNHNSVVYLVSPPVTQVSFTKYKVKQQSYVDEEETIVKKLNNPNVHFFNVFSEMKQYMAENHQDVKEFGTNTWHPNSMGHIIATNLLLQDIERVVGHRAPTYHVT